MSSELNAANLDLLADLSLLRQLVDQLCDKWPDFVSQTVSATADNTAATVTVVLNLTAARLFLDTP